MVDSIGENGTPSILNSNVVPSEDASQRCNFLENIFKRAEQTISIPAKSYALLQSISVLQIEKLGTEKGVTDLLQFGRLPKASPTCAWKLSHITEIFLKCRAFSQHPLK